MSIGKNKKADGLWSVGFLCLFIIGFTEQMGFITIRTVITPYAKDVLLLDPALLGTLTGMLSVASMFSRPVASKILAKVTHKTILATAICVGCLAMVSYMFVTDFTMLLVVRLIHGFAYGISNTTLVAMAGNSISAERMGNGMGIFGIGQMIGLGIAPTLSMAIYNAAGARVTFIFAGCCSVIGIVLALITPNPKYYVRPAASAKSGGLKNMFIASVLPSATLNFFVQFAYQAVAAFIIVYGQHRDWAQVGLYYTVYAGGSLIVRPLMGKLYDKKGMTFPVLISASCMLISMVMLAFAENFVLFLVSAAVMTVGFGGGWCVFQADALKVKNPMDRGRASATYFLVQDIATFLSATLSGQCVSHFAGYDFTVGGRLIDDAGYSLTFLIFTIPLFLNVVFYFLVYRPRHKRIEAMEKAST